jgi:hypothetical protein
LFLLYDIGHQFVNWFSTSGTHLIGLVFSSCGDTYMRAYLEASGLGQFEIYTYLFYLSLFFPSK